MQKTEQKKVKNSRILNIKNLTIEAYAGDDWKPIVDNIDLYLEKGEVLGLIGESGAGKSTLGLAAMGYTRPGCRISSGTIEFSGIELTDASEKKQQKLRGSRIAYVAQSAAASFNPAHRLIKQFTEVPVDHGIMNKAEAQANAIKLYERLDLPEPEVFGFRFPHQISGGQLQRAMVAMAMACKPDLIIFDEPTTALDVTTQIEVLATIKYIVKDFDMAAIYISHDLSLVIQLADRIMVLRNGKLVEENDVENILDKPEKDYTRRLLAVRNFRGKRRPVKKGENILEVENLTAGYKKDVPVISDVSFRIKRARTVAVVGESGSGKSTLARAITGLLPPMQGSTVFDGEIIPPSLNKRSKEMLRRIQMIYQMPDMALNPKQKIGKILGRPLNFYFGYNHHEQEEKIIDLLEMVELSKKYMERYPSELSGGERQRICIARALAAEPDLIICDEVTSALDQLVAEEVLKLLLNLQHELAVSYLFITHDLATVKAVADEIVVMYQGEVVEYGKKPDILTPPHHEYTELLLSSVPEMDPDWLDGILAKREQAGISASI